MSADQAAQTISFITGMAKQVGLEYHLDKTPVVNTFKAHRLLHLAKKYGKQNEMEEALFDAYFTQGKNIDDDATLLQLASSIGLDDKETTDVLRTNAFGDDVKNDIRRAQQLGIRGVPFF